MTRRSHVPTVQEIHGLEEVVDLAALYTGALFRILYWRCLHDGRLLREERTNAWDVLTMVDHGAFVHHMGGERAMVDASSVVLNEAWRPYRTTHPFGCGDHGFHVLMRRDVLREALADGRSRIRSPGIRMARIGGRSRAALSQRLLVRRLRRGLPVDPLAAEETVLELLDDVLDHLPLPDPRPSPRRAARREHGELAEAVRCFLFERLAEPLKIEDVARAVHVSPFHLCRTFKLTTGETIHQYRNRLRLTESLEPAGEPGTDLTALALDLGFSSHSHFTAAFRSLFAMTPSEYRRLTTARRDQAARNWKNAVVKLK